MAGEPLLVPALAVARPVQARRAGRAAARGRRARRGSRCRRARRRAAAARRGCRCRRSGSGRRRARPGGGRGARRSARAARAGSRPRDWHGEVVAEGDRIGAAAAAAPGSAGSATGRRCACPPSVAVAVRAPGAVLVRPVASGVAVELAAPGADPEQRAGALVARDHARSRRGRRTPRLSHRRSRRAGRCSPNPVPSTNHCARDAGGVDVGGGDDLERRPDALVAGVVDRGLVAAHLGGDPGHLDDVEALADVGDAGAAAARARRRRAVPRRSRRRRRRSRRRGRTPTCGWTRRRCPRSTASMAIS